MGQEKWQRGQACLYSHGINASGRGWPEEADIGGHIANHSPTTIKYILQLALNS